jgi:hypothetical protein
VARKHSMRIRGGRSWMFVLGAVALFGVLAALPVILPAIDVHLIPVTPTSSNGVKLLRAPRAPAAVTVAKVATPVDPADAPAELSSGNAAQESAMVSAEDKRLRTILHDAADLYQPEVIPTRGSLPTLVLTAGQAPYTADTLVEYGAMVMLPNNSALLLDNVFVSTNATLDLGGSNLRTLYMDSGSGGFATIVAWNGNLSFAGTSAQPLTIMGWDRTKNAPAADTGDGRSYIREVAGRLSLTNTRVSALGFWSGRTGGVAWTGLEGKPSTGGATGSSFTDDTYGAFVSRGEGLDFSDDLFEYNQLDGLHIHRYSTDISVTSSSAVRNGGNGFVVSPATDDTLLRDDISEHNAGNGYFINGRPLATGASAYGGSIAPGTGTTLNDSASLNNGEMAILVEGGTGTAITSDQICTDVTGIAVRDGISGAVVTGNDIRCAPKSGISVGPTATGTVLAGNTIVGARTGILVQDTSAVAMYDNVISEATVFGVSVRGAGSQVSGVGNTISGTGFRAVDYRSLAPAPNLSETNSSGWTTHVRVTFLSYLVYHPLAAMWLSMLVVVLLAWVITRFRRMPSHPYPASTRWVPEHARVLSTAVTEPMPVLATPNGGGDRS